MEQTEDERITRREVIEQDKEGTLEKVYFPETWKMMPQKDGTQKAELVEPWEVRATGRKTEQLRGAFKDIAPQMMHEGWKEWNSIGETTITKPDGSTDVVRADKEEYFRGVPGFCERATRPTFTVNVPWEGAMKRDGIRRQRITKHYTETWYRDGRHVLEERNGHNGQ